MGQASKLTALGFKGEGLTPMGGRVRVFFVDCPTLPPPADAFLESGCCGNGE